LGKSEKLKYTIFWIYSYTQHPCMHFESTLKPKYFQELSLWFSSVGYVISISKNRVHSTKKWYFQQISWLSIITQVKFLNEFTHNNWSPTSYTILTVHLWVLAPTRAVREFKVIYTIHDVPVNNYAISMGTPHICTYCVHSFVYIVCPNRFGIHSCISTAYMLYPFYSHMQCSHV